MCALDVYVRDACVCVQEPVYVCMCVHVCVRMSVRVCVHACMLALDAYVRASERACVHVCVRACARASRICACMRGEHACAHPSLSSSNLTCVPRAARSEAGVALRLSERIDDAIACFEAALVVRVCRVLTQARARALTTSRCLRLTRASGLRGPTSRRSL
jgi:hypothetical protein